MGARSTKTPQELGREYELELVGRYGGRAQPGSGSTPCFKLDWRVGGLIVSAKRTLARSYRLTAEDLQEALAGAQGPAGRGETPVMALRMEGFPDDVFVVRGRDLRAILAGEVDVSLDQTRRSSKLAAADRRLRDV